MSDTTTEQNGDQEVTEGQESTEETNAAETSIEEEKSGEQESKKDDELPDWAREKLTKANAEAAKYRTRVKELNDKLKAVEDASGKVEALTQQATDASAEAETAKLALLKLQTALSVEGIEAKNASEFADLLQGSTEDELKAHAEKVKKLLGVSRSRATDPTQGRSGDVKPSVGPGVDRLTYAYSNSK